MLSVSGAAAQPCLAVCGQEPHSLLTGLSPWAYLHAIPWFSMSFADFQQQMWLELLGLPFWPRPGTAHGKAAASPGDKESHTASGHILNSSIVRQEEMCLGNVAVTTLKHHNSILTTSLRRCRSDKHGERGGRAVPAAGPRLPLGRAWGASRSLLRGCPPRSKRKPTSPGASCAPSLCSDPAPPLQPKADPASLPCEGILIPHPAPTPSLPQPRGIARAVLGSRGSTAAPG